LKMIKHVKTDKKSVRAVSAPSPSSGVKRQRSRPAKVQYLSHPNWKRMKDHFDLLRSAYVPVDSKKARSSKGPLGSIRDRKLVAPSPSWADEEDEPEDALASALAGAASIFTDPNVTYTFRLVAPGTINATNTIQTLTYISWDPSAFGEYSSYLKFLFSEVRIRRAKLHLVPIGGSNSGDSVIFACASDLGYTTTSPTAYSQVLENPNSKQFSSWYVRDHEPTWDVVVPSDYNYSPVSSPAALVNAGCYGEFMVGQQLAANATEPVFAYLLELILEFKSRT